MNFLIFHTFIKILTNKNLEFRFLEFIISLHLLQKSTCVFRTLVKMVLHAQTEELTSTASANLVTLEKHVLQVITTLCFLDLFLVELRKVLQLYFSQVIKEGREGGTAPISSTEKIKNSNPNEENREIQY